MSLSARMLARSARRAGIRPVALDLYADADTREYARACLALPAGPSGFDGAVLVDAAARLAPSADCGLVYGSGFDGAPDVLAALARGRKLYGNPPELLRRLKRPDCFFGLLDELRIPYPETRFSPPPDPENWLVKAGCGEGGKRVRFCAHEKPAGPDEYCQRRLPGPALSALFLADGAAARIVGFNTLTTVATADRPFLFGGAVNRTSLDSAQQCKVESHVAALVKATGLRGLNSLDFIQDGRTSRVLEINPRPSSTLALYDADFPAGLLASHIRACEGRLDDCAGAGRVARAFAVALAPRDLRVPESLAWPAWCADRPVAGSLVRAGEPLCTVEAEGAGGGEAETLVARRRIEILERFSAAV